ncbi:MAG: hypothetical protein EOP91_06990, partial [Lysobacteraceae bacterium]
MCGSAVSRDRQSTAKPKPPGDSSPRVAANDAPTAALAPCTTRSALINAASLPDLPMRPLHAISPSFRTRAGRWTLAARVLACLCLGMLAACATIAPAGDPSAALTFVVVRHAEKAGDDPRDPSLSEAGQARAQALARLLADEPLTAAHATGYRRTQQTAQPAADAHSLRLTLYDAQLPAT